jgi:hypothetical protein
MAAPSPAAGLVGGRGTSQLLKPHLSGSLQACAHEVCQPGHRGIYSAREEVAHKRIGPTALPLPARNLQAGREAGRQGKHSTAQHSTAQHSLVSLGCARLTVLLEMGRRWPAAASQPSQADDGTDPIHNLLLSEYMHSCMHTVSWVLTPRIASTR